MFRKNLFFVLFMAGALLSLNAKNSIGIELQVGVIGSEKQYSTSSLVSGQSISMPYTKTTFEPDVFIGANIPICNIGQKVCFGLDLGYNFAWNCYKSSTDSYESISSVFLHKISLLPEISFEKSKFHFFAGTGIAFGFEPYYYETTLTGTPYKHETIDFKIFWILSTGFKYQCTEHLFAVADVSFHFTVFDYYIDNDYKSKSSGTDTPEFLPKIGLMYCF